MLVPLVVPLTLVRHHVRVLDVAYRRGQLYLQPRGRLGVSWNAEEPTMRYLLRQRVLAWGDDYTIKNADGRDVYFVDGKVFSFGNHLSFQDMSGNELLQIRQKLLSIGPQYEIHRGDETVAIVKKRLFTLARARFSVDVPGPDDLEARGDFLDHEYLFERAGREVARVSKRWFSIADTYAVDVDADQDDVLILACALVIDLVSHPDDEGR